MNKLRSTKSKTGKPRLLNTEPLPGGGMDQGGIEPETWHLSPLPYLRKEKLQLAKASFRDMIVCRLFFFFYLWVGIR